MIAEAVEAVPEMGFWLVYVLVWRVVAVWIFCFKAKLRRDSRFDLVLWSGMVEAKRREGGRGNVQLICALHHTRRIET